MRLRFPIKASVSASQPHTPFSFSGPLQGPGGMCREAVPRLWKITLWLSFFCARASKRTAMPPLEPVDWTRVRKRRELPAAVDES